MSAKSWWQPGSAGARHKVAGVSDDEKWRPRTLPSAIVQGRLDRLNPQTGELQFRNGSNLFWGYVLAWGLFALAAALLNKSSLSDSDPMSPTEVVEYAAATFLASTGALIVLARPYVTLSHDVLTVRNPLRTYRLAAKAVESLTSGVWGFPRLRVVWGEHAASAIWDAAIVKVILGGGSNARDLEDLSKLLGQREEKQTSTSRGADGRRTHSTTTARVPILEPAQLRTLPFGKAIMSYVPPNPSTSP